MKVIAVICKDCKKKKDDIEFKVIHNKPQILVCKHNTIYEYESSLEKKK